ncbi:hypothetical protein AB9E15_33920, partial [Rhizobium leguminosarum]|uniref:hypothetical protein n=1 Tax=Rhizobium leguminosarum TaxID=384 RepID=UPI003F95AAEE
TYFRINEKGTGQFERTLIIAEDGSFVFVPKGVRCPMELSTYFYVQLHGPESPPFLTPPRPRPSRSNATTIRIHNVVSH